MQIYPKPVSFKNSSWDYKIKTSPYASELYGLRVLWVFHSNQLIEKKRKFIFLGAFIGTVDRKTFDSKYITSPRLSLVADALSVCSPPIHGARSSAVLRAYINFVIFVFRFLLRSSVFIKYQILTDKNAGNIVRGLLQLLQFPKE